MFGAYSYQIENAIIKIVKRYGISPPQRVGAGFLPNCQINNLLTYSFALFC
jgi:hypothetical protein